MGGGVTPPDVSYQQTVQSVLDALAVDPYGTITSYQQTFGGHPQGSGRMAARGYAQGSARAAERLSAATGVQQRQIRSEDLAYAAFERTNPFEPGFEVQGATTFLADKPKTKALLAKNVTKLRQLQAKKQTAKVLAKERKVQSQINLRVAKLAPETEVRVSTLTGPNAGYWRERGAPPPAWLLRRGGYAK